MSKEVWLVNKPALVDSRETVIVDSKTDAIRYLFDYMIDEPNENAVYDDQGSFVQLFDRERADVVIWAEEREAETVEVGTFSVGTHGYCPAVNCKLHGVRIADTDDLEDKFICDKATLQRAIEWALESHTAAFWEESVPQIMAEHFGWHVKWSQEGRSGGWLEVIHPVETEMWSAKMVKHWAKFERAIKDEIRELCSPEQIAETIKVNDWAVMEQPGEH